MNRPVIGIVGYAHVVPWFFGDLPVTGAPTRYVGAVAAAGGRPVLLPGTAAESMLDVVDALVLTGGGDLDPALTGGDPAVAVETDPARDHAELSLVRAAEAAGVPLLGVCRGMQVLAIARGGTLLGDLGMTHVLPDIGHEVRTRPGSLAAGLLGNRPRTTSLHHQGVADPGPNWAATAWADDGVVEAIEVEDAPRNADVSSAAHMMRHLTSRAA